MSASTRDGAARVLRTPTSNNPPGAGTLMEGELSVEMNDPMRIWIGVPTSLDPTGRRLLYDKSTIPPGGPFVPVSGGTMTGPLTLHADPTAPMHAATKQYVDKNFAPIAGGGYVQKTGDTMTGALTFEGLAAGPFDLTKHLRLNAAGTAGLNSFFGGGISYNTAADAGHIFYEGGTRTLSIHNAGVSMQPGMYLNLGMDPTAPLHAVTKQYLDTNFAPIAGGGYVQKTGDEMSGPLTLVGDGAILTLALDPTADMHAVTRRYLAANSITQPNADARYVNVSGDTMTGNLTVPNAFVKVTGGTGTLWLGDNTATGASIIFNAQVSNRGILWQTAGANRWQIYLSGLESSGEVGSNWNLLRYTDAGVNAGNVLTFSRTTGLGTVAGDPTDPLGIATRRYVDNNSVTQAAGDARWVNVTGDTMSGGLGFATGAVASSTDLSKHIKLHTAGYGFSITGGHLNLVTEMAGAVSHVVGGVERLTVSNALVSATLPIQTTGSLTVNGTTGLNGNVVANNNLAVGATSATGTLTVGHSAAATLAAINLNTIAGAPKYLTFQSGAKARWSWQTSASPEAGANAGADFRLVRYNDAGGSLGDALFLSRGTGLATVAGNPTLPLGIATKGYTDAADALLQMEIDVLAEDLFFIGGLDVPADVGNYTVVSGIPNGSPLPVAVEAYKGFFVIVTQGGEPPAASNIPQGVVYSLADWIVSNGSEWIHLPIGQAKVIAQDVDIVPAIGLLGPNVQTGLDWLNTNKVDFAQGDARWVNTTGDTMTGMLVAPTLQAGNSGNPGRVNIQGITTNTPSVVFSLTGLGTRWTMGVDRFAESGGNVGSGFAFYSYADDGSYIGNPVTIRRNTGQLSLTGGISMYNTLGVNNWDVSKHIALWGTTFGFGITSNRLNMVAPNTATINLMLASADRLTIGNTVTTSTVPIALPGDPTAPLHAVTKQYVDTNSITPAAGDARWVNVTGDKMTGSLGIAGSGRTLAIHLNAVANGVGFSSALATQLTVGPVDVAGVALTPHWAQFMATTFYAFDGTVNTSLIFSSSAVANKLISIGMSGSGQITSGSPGRIQFNQYTEVEFYNGRVFMPRLPTAAPTDPVMLWNNSGFLSIGADALPPVDLATGDARWVNVAGDTMTGGLGFSNGNVVTVPTDLSKHIALYGGTYGFSVSSGTMNIVSGGTVSIIPSNLIQTAYFNNTGLVISPNRDITLARDPTLAMHAVPKQYVDANSLTQAAADARFVNVTGDTMTGALTITAPVTPTTGTLFIRPAAGTLAQESKLRFGGTFASGTDLGPRFVASIRSGMTAAWGTEYLDVWVGFGTNDANSDATQRQVARFANTGTTFPLRANFNAGVAFNGGVSPAASDLTRHISLYGGTYGFSITSSTLNHVSGIQHAFWSGAQQIALFNGTGIALSAGRQLTLAVDPTLALHAATKQYVDAKTYPYLPLAGGTVTGATKFAGPNPQLHIVGPAATWRTLQFYTDALARWNIQADASAETGANAGSDLIVTRWADAGNAPLATIKINRASGLVSLLTNTMAVSRDPLAPLEVATKAYVDAQLAAGGGGDFLPLSGGVLANPGDLRVDGTFTAKGWFNNIYSDGTDYRYIADGAAWALQVLADSMYWMHAPSGAAGAVAPIVSIAEMYTDGTFLAKGELRAGKAVSGYEAITVLGGSADAYPQYQFKNVNAPTGHRNASVYMDPNGGLTMQFVDDGWTAGFAFFLASRLGTLASRVDLMATNIGLTGAVGVTGGLTVAGNLGAGVINGTDVYANGHLVAQGANGSMGVSSHHIGNSGVGFWNNNNVLYFGNTDGTVPLYHRAYIDSAGSMVLNGSLSVSGEGGIYTPYDVAARQLTSSGRTYCGDMMNYGGVFYVAGNYNYYFQRRSDGHWLMVENGVARFDMDTYGNLSISAAMSCGTTLRAYQGAWFDGGTFQAYNNGAAKVFQWQSDWHEWWTVANGQRGYSIPNATQLVYEVVAPNAYVIFNWIRQWAGVGAYWDISDERLKRDVEPYEDDGLAAILKIDPIRFHRHRPPNVPTPFGDEPLELGFSAQQLREALPDAVHDTVPNPNAPPELRGVGMLAVSTTPIVAALVNAVKTLNARIATLEQRTLH